MLQSSIKAHTDWVRDVSWNTSLGSENVVIASCSEVNLIHKK